MKEELKQIKEDAFNELKNKKLDIEDIRIKYLGKKGELTKILRGMKELPKEERPVIGKLANEVRSTLENAIEEASKKIKSNDTQAKLENETIDITMPGVKQTVGKRHPLEQT